MSLVELSWTLQTLRNPCSPAVPSPHLICPPHPPARDILHTWTGQCQTGSPVSPDKRNQRTRNSHRGTTCKSLIPWRCRMPCTCSSSTLPHVGHRAVHRD